MFAALSPDAIEQIEQLEVTRLGTWLTERGYLITIPDDVIRLIATTGYDAAFDARHPQRNIEFLLLEPVASVSTRELSAQVVDGRVVWRERGPEEGEGELSVTTMSAEPSPTASIR